QSRPKIRYFTASTSRKGTIWLSALATFPSRDEGRSSARVSGCSPSEGRGPSRAAGRLGKAIPEKDCSQTNRAFTGRLFSFARTEQGLWHHGRPLGTYNGW